MGSALVDEAILERLGQLRLADLRSAPEIGDRARHPQDPMIPPRGQLQALGGMVEESSAARIEPAGAVEHSGGQTGIQARLAMRLDLARAEHAVAHGGGGLAWGTAAKGADRRRA